MITKLGIVSGEILTLFDKIQGPLCLQEIEMYLNEPGETILMSLGWLTREGLISVEYVNGSHFFKRKQKEEIPEGGGLTFEGKKTVSLLI